MNNCCTWMMVRTHWGSVRECMTQEQYDSFLDSMHHDVPWWVVVIIVLVFIIFMGITIYMEKKDPYSDYRDMF